jgi:carbon monoxide dehydrogenase subunit G
MHFEGTFTVKAPRERVFEFLLDPKKISSCLPDLQKLDVRSDEEYMAIVKAGISFIKGEFTMNFKVVEKQPPTHAKLVARGSGIGSTVDLETVMDLTESSGNTTMKWSAEARVGGRIASVGQRLIGSQAEKIVRQLFDCVKSKLEVS